MTSDMDGLHGRLESLGTAPTERAAAELVAARLTEVYGPGWPLLYRGWDARRARPWRAWWRPWARACRWRRLLPL